MDEPIINTSGSKYRRRGRGGVPAELVWIAIGIGLVVATAAWLLNRPKRPDRQAQQAAIDANLIEVDAADLIAAYAANEIDADRAFKDKRFVVVGTVSIVGRGSFNEPYVVLGSSGFVSVQCGFSRLHEAELAKLRPGMYAKIACTGMGVESLAVMVTDCELRLVSDR